MEKRGQFFLVAALVISGILIGLAGVYTEVSSPKEDLSVYDLSDELNYESLQVIDQGVYSGLSDADLYENVVNLTDYYAKKNSNKEFIIVYGSDQSLKFRKYSLENIGNIGVSAGGSTTGVDMESSTIEDGTIATGADRIGEEVCFTFRNGQEHCTRRIVGTQFTTVISFKSKDEVYVASDGVASDGKRTIFNCNGDAPVDGPGIFFISSTYDSTKVSQDQSAWTFIELDSLVNSASETMTLESCQWTCKFNYVYQDNGCVPQQTGVV